MATYTSDKEVSPIGAGRTWKACERKTESCTPLGRASPVLIWAAALGSCFMFMRRISHSGGWLSTCDTLLDTVAYPSGKWPLKTFMVHIPSPWKEITDDHRTQQASRGISEEGPSQRVGRKRRDSMVCCRC